MVTSGVAPHKVLDLDFKDKTESMVHVMVHNLKHPFLNSKMVYTKQLNLINLICNPTSDMAVFAKKGSVLVKEKHEQAEQAKAAVKIASLGRTSLGNIIGVHDEEADVEAAGAYLHTGWPHASGLSLLPWWMLRNSFFSTTSSMVLQAWPLNSVSFLIFQCQLIICTI